MRDSIAHQEEVPAGVSVASIKDAVATLRCGDEWESKLTLVPAPRVPQSTPEGPGKVEEV